MSKIDEFKSFVKTKPELITYVKNNEMTWQRFYEIWDIYGPNSEEWDKYKPKDDSSVKESTSENKDESSSRMSEEKSAKELFGINDLFNMLKKVDLNSIKNNISGIQKAITLIQDMTSKAGVDKVDIKPSTSAYNPRPIFRRFED